MRWMGGRGAYPTSRALSRPPYATHCIWASRLLLPSLSTPGPRSGHPNHCAEAARSPPPSPPKHTHHGVPPPQVYMLCITAGGVWTSVAEPLVVQGPLAFDLNSTGPTSAQPFSITTIGWGLSLQDRYTPYPLPIQLGGSRTSLRGLLFPKPNHSDPEKQFGGSFVLFKRPLASTQPGAFSPNQARGARIRCATRSGRRVFRP